MNVRSILVSLGLWAALFVPCVADVPEPVSLDGNWRFKWGADGIVDSDRTPQRDYWEAKDVYAPIEVTSDRIPFRPGQKRVFIDVRNGYDFLDLSSVDLSWKLFRNARQIDSGKARLQALPHTTAALKIPTTAIKTGDVEAVYYVQLTSTRPDGTEITTEAVRLGLKPPPQPDGPANTQKPKVTRARDRVIVTVGLARYEFNPGSGEIAAITVQDRSIAGPSRLVVWRPATYCERNRLDLRPNRHHWNTYMQGLAGVAKKWEVTESGQTVVITAETEYRQDDLNGVLCHMIYLISASGTLHVDLEVEPHLDVPEIPEIGIEFDVPAGLKSLTWLGEGPIDSLPGKSEATYFGWWKAAPGESVAQGTKSGIEWARLVYENNTALHVKDCAGIRLEAKILRILTHLAAPWCKNGPAERPEWQLSLAEGRTFKGSFEIIPIMKALD
jgi:beta-galactosidase